MGKAARNSAALFPWSHAQIRCWGGALGARVLGFMLKSGAAVSCGAHTLGYMPKSGVGVGLGARALGFYCRGLLCQSPTASLELPLLAALLLGPAHAALCGVGNAMRV